MTSHPVNRKHTESEENPSAQFRDTKDILYARDQFR
jgi:hypothetical protein